MRCRFVGVCYAGRVGQSSDVVLYRASHENSELYIKKHTMLTIRNVLNSYANAQSKEDGLPNIKLTGDTAFNECNEMVKAMGKVLSREGKANV